MVVDVCVYSKVEKKKQTLVGRADTTFFLSLSLREREKEGVEKSE